MPGPRREWPGNARLVSVPWKRLGLDSDVAPAVWIQPLLVEDSLQVRMMVPQGFEAYARIFAPFDDHITWTEVARRHGRAARAL